MRGATFFKNPRRKILINVPRQELPRGAALREVERYRSALRAIAPMAVASKQSD